jgi:hypothetical protein
MRKKTDFIVIHCSWSPPSADWSVKDIDRMHRERGFLRVGYHYVARRDGTLEVGRPLDAVGAHAYPFNSSSVGICLIGGMAEGSREDEDNFTDAQKLTLDGVLRTLMDFYPDAIVVPHGELNRGKTCPVMDVDAFLRQRGLFDENERRREARMLRSHITFDGS